MDRSRTVVVGIDGSQSALEAARWAADEALRRRLSLRLVAAFGWTTEVVVGHPGLGDRHREIMLAHTHRALRAAEAAVLEHAPDVEVTRELIVGYPIGVLVAESRRAELIVVGDRGLSRVGGLLLGSVAMALAAHGACPVVVVRGTVPATAAPAPVVVGIDGSPASEAALEFAYDEAATRGAPLVAVHAWFDMVADPVLAPLLDWDAIEDDERVVLAERLAGWAEKYPDVEVRRVVVRDRPVHALLGEAAGAALLVVGSRGRGGFAGLVLGSVGHALLHRSPCPLAVVRPAGEAP